MAVQLNVEQAAQLSQMADQTGRSADKLAREAVDRYFREESRFHAGFKPGWMLPTVAILSPHPKSGQE
jgi:hypothetical protein